MAVRAVAKRRAMRWWTEAVWGGSNGHPLTRGEGGGGGTTTPFKRRPGVGPMHWPAPRGSARSLPRAAPPSGLRGPLGLPRWRAPGHCREGGGGLCTRSATTGLCSVVRGRPPLHPEPKTDGGPTALIRHPRSAMRWKGRGLGGGPRGG